MKLTCCCGASIDIKEFTWDDRFDKFEKLHAPCLSRWREKGVFVPMYTVQCDSAGREMFRRCTTCGGIINPTHYHKGMTLCGCEHPTPFDQFVDKMVELLAREIVRNTYAKKPIIQHGDQAIKGICRYCGSSINTLRNALNVDHVARCTVRALWEAANR